MFIFLRLNISYLFFLYLTHMGFRTPIDTIYKGSIKQGLESRAVVAAL